MISGKTTLHAVTQYATERGLEPIQLDYIPDGFAYKSPDITIGAKTHKGEYIAFSPNVSWESPHAIIRAEDEETLLIQFKKHNKYE